MNLLRFDVDPIKRKTLGGYWAIVCCVYNFERDKYISQNAKLSIRKES